ncbi:MAG: hypothetical protein ACR2PM_00665 [Hyphomicrobiales bacterium]
MTEKTGHVARSDAEDSGHQKDVADWHMRVLTGIYGQDTMVRKFPNTVALSLGRRAIIRAIGHMSPEQLAHGEKTLESQPGNWPPAPGEFARMCIRAPEHSYTQRQLTHKHDPAIGRAWIKKIRANLGQTDPNDREVKII